MSFTIGSLFDGSGGFPLAATLCGGTPKWASEVEPYPIAVTKSRFPGMKHLGSVTEINGGEVEPVDVITFGSPCQDLSVAGKRAGLKHEANGDDETTRSGLFMEAVRIIKEMREATNGVYPRFALWENVPGAFSSNKGEDFRIVLQELIQIIEPSAVMPEVPKNGWPYADSYSGDGWSLAYRVLDAQFWGVPQRRRRIYLVLDLRGECAGKVSFEREGLRGYFETGRTPWQAAPGDAEGGTGAADCKSIGINGEIAATLDASYYKGCGMRQGVEREIVAAPIAYSLDPVSSNSMKSSNPHSGCRQVEVARCLDTTDPNPCKNQGGTVVVEQVPYTLKIRSGCEGGGKGALIQTDMSATLSTLNDQYLFQPVIDTCILDDQGGSQISVRDDGKCPTLRAETHGNLPCVLSVENHPADSRVDIDDSGKVQTLTSRMGTGGGNVPMVMEPRVFRKGTRPHSADEAQKWGEAETANTLNTFDQGEARASELVVESRVYESHPMDSRIKELDGVSPTVSAKWHKGAADTPLVCEGTPVYCLQGGGATSQNSQGMGHKANTSYTLNTTDVHAVVYCVGNGQLNQITMAETANTLDCMHDQQAVCYVDTSHADDVVRVDDVTAPLQERDYKGGKLVTYGVDCRNATEYPELTGALQADSAHNLNSNNVIRVQYIVRRLTPTECARLQGFPDKWGHPIEKTDFTDEEYKFWLNVRNTHAAINDKATKDYTKDQMLKWYNSLHTDSSEYKMWGNGIALPNALYIMQGIAEVMSEEKAARRKWLNDLLGGCL